MYQKKGSASRLVSLVPAHSSPIALSEGIEKAGIVNIPRLSAMRSSAKFRLIRGQVALCLPGPLPFPLAFPLPIHLASSQSSGQGFAPLGVVSPQVLWGDGLVKTGRFHSPSIFLSKGSYFKYFTHPHSVAVGTRWICHSARCRGGSAPHGSPPRQSAAAPF
jgi:hypothetical protein